MEINHLREFVVLAQTGNFLEAAQQVYTSQSALSKHIKKMETELGVILFERTTRKVRLSKYGEILLPYATQIIDLDSQSNAQIRNSLNTEEEVLNLGAIPALAQYAITDKLAWFKKSRSQSRINLIQNDSQTLIQMLKEDKIELAFIRFDGTVDEDLSALPYAEDKLAAVLPAGHALSAQTKINLADLREESFLLVKEDSMLYRLAVEACQQAGFTPKVSYTDHHLENLLELVNRGMGVALLMEPLAAYLKVPQTRIIEIHPPVTTRINLCYRKERNLSPSAKHFLTGLDG